MRRLIAAAAVLAATAGPALAHLDPAEHGSFMAGLSHPIFGADHVLAMVTVGVWAALIGGRAIWLVPTTFVVTMMMGFAAAVAGVSLPFVEPTILASVIVLGLLAAIALRVPTRVGMAIVGFFAVFHGFAHGSELGGAGAASYAAGFAVSTALLHVVGIALCIGLMRALGSDNGRFVSRIAGAAAAASGLFLALG